MTLHVCGIRHKCLLHDPCLNTLFIFHNLWKIMSAKLGRNDIICVYNHMCVWQPRVVFQHSCLSLEATPFVVLTYTHFFINIVNATLTKWTCLCLFVYLDSRPFLLALGYLDVLEKGTRVQTTRAMYYSFANEIPVSCTYQMYKIDTWVLSLLLYYGPPAWNGT